MMLKSNYRLVISVVKRYRGRGMSLQDLITEGMQVRVHVLPLLISFNAGVS
jgi:hypothetical protein